MLFRRRQPRHSALRVAGFLLPAAMLVAAPKVDFNRDIRPVLSDNCFACHGPDASKVKGGLRLDDRDRALQPAKSGKVALVPGKPEASELIFRIQTADADDRMPPAESHKTLTPAQKDLLRRWIAEGAEYKGHWAYAKPARIDAPPGPAAVDFFVGRRLAEAGIKPAPEADRRTLLRRLSWDLSGLPPTPEEIAAFENDPSPDAYERRVEALLASPRYGERMALPWLDAVRFADTIGYHSDTPRNIWPYRDYVIRAFNRNMPFDQFTREQLAGDLLPNPTLDQKVASGFNRLLLTTEEGGAQARDYEARYLTDRVRAVGSVWLGQTIGCAQCHDHKFDPITSRDFYSMGAFFADVSEAIVGAREPGMPVPDDDQSVVLALHERDVAALQREWDGPHPGLSNRFENWQDAERARILADALWVAPKAASATSAEGAELRIRDDASILVAGKNPERDTYVVRFTNGIPHLAGLQVEVLPDDSLPSKGPGRAGNGNFVLTELTVRVESPSAPARTLNLRNPRASIEQASHVDTNPYGRWSAASAVDGDTRGETAGWAILPQVGRPQRLRVTTERVESLAPDDALVVELRQRHGDGHNLGRFRIQWTGDSGLADAAVAESAPAEIASLLRTPPGALDDAGRSRLFEYYKETDPQLAPLRQRLAAARKAKSDFEATLPRTLVTMRADAPRVVRILPRGNWMIETGEEVAPALPAFLAPQRTAPARLTRLDLADWIVSPENPLTARVIVNRVWRQFFGTGLSKVADDFGAQGEPPSHPELLDWLACEFRDSGWDLKHLVRLIVLSGTYRQDSKASRELMARDPDNRLLARQGRWRIEAELVRDQALSLGGLLVADIGGPSAKPYQPPGYWENLNFPVRDYDASPGAQQYRRGLYTWWQRSYVHPSLLAFDAPTREECAAERNRSNIPQQALVLLNDPSYVEAARGFAVRILKAPATEGDAARADWAWRQVLGRAPSASERKTVLALLEKHRSEFRSDPESAGRFLKMGATPPPPDLDAASLAAWTDVARALLSLHETLTRS
ncbi:MAG: PSD1 domain-containing protein [Verrucomicrobiales bacterium]|nr:PSD1 domain-containing protein [Verrucomicrobiales bacterium]